MAKRRVWAALLALFLTSAARSVEPVPQSAPAVFEGHVYSTLSLLSGAIVGPVLPDGPKAVPALNRAMQAWLQTSLAEYKDCQADLRERDDLQPEAMDFSKEMAPIFWRTQVIVLRESYAYYCGGAHPSNGVGAYVVWDLRADKSIEPWLWIRGSKNKRGDYEAPVALRKVLRAAAAKRADRECAGAVKDSDYYLVYPTHKGLVFSPSLPHVAQGCAQDVQLTYHQLQPYLTAPGRQAATALFAQP